MAAAERRTLVLPWDDFRDIVRQFHPHGLFYGYDFKHALLFPNRDLTLYLSPIFFY